MLAEVSVTCTPGTPRPEYGVTLILRAAFATFWNACCISDAVKGLEVTSNVSETSLVSEAMLACAPNVQVVLTAEIP